MLSLNGRSMRSTVAALLVAFFSLSAPTAAATEDPRSPDKSNDRDASVTAETPEPKSPRVLYAAFEAISTVEPTPEPTTRPRSVAKMLDSVSTVTPPPPVPLPPPRQSSSVISTAPMSVGEKFGTWFRGRFMTIGPFASAAVSGMWKELQDNDDFKEDTVENFFADSATRAARAYAAGATSSFYERAVLASLFKQDPRYHRSNKTGFGKVIYAATRVFVTQGDRCACHQVNYSFLLGGAGYAVTANLWERSERTGPWHTFARFYNHIAYTAMFNIVREFVGGQ